MSIGDRVAYGDKRGTIRFVGEIPPFSGIYYGIDWDSPNDGKHNGIYKNIRYFHSTYPKSGSFVKSTEVNFGQNFVQALKEQYDYDVNEARKDYESSMRKFDIKVYDFPDLEKIKQLQGPLKYLKIVNLAAYNVKSPGYPGEIKRECPNIVELDLSNNLMTNWNSIADIGEQLKELRILYLNNTRLSIPKESHKLKNSFQKLESLFLCHTVYTWQDILKIAEMFPQLVTLKVSNSNLQILERPSMVLQNLQYLDIQGNKIYKWSEICKLGFLPKLEILNACDTGISEIIIKSEEKLFSSLHTLYISENNIKNFTDITDLNNLPRLKNLRISKNPITSIDRTLSYRDKIIARIGNLEILNGCEIDSDERRNAEFDYLRQFAQNWFNCMNNSEEKSKFLFENPRYLLLIQKYGPVEIPTEIDPSIKGHLITVYLANVTKDGIKDTVKKQIHLSLTVHKLITIVKRIFKIKSEQLSLVYVSKKNQDIKIELNDYLKSLSAYGVEDGDTIYISY